MLIKTIRNTSFTLIVLVLAAIALSWNHQVIIERLTSLQAASPPAVTSTSGSILPLQVYAESSPVKVGGTFEATIMTKPNANLSIQLISPKAGVTSVFETAQTTSSGYYIFQHQMSDYNFVGRVSLVVTVTSGETKNVRATSFILDTWGGSLSSELPQTSYQHPLVP